MLRRWYNSDRAQDSFEYLLAILLIGIPIVSGLMYGFSLLVPEVLRLACPAIDTAGVGSCF